MKRMLKRTLSLILAMIMVMGVLPMNAMAAMIMGDPDGGRMETPVIDRSDPIVDTHAVSISHGHERPEIPPEESEQPADPLWDDLTVEIVSIDADTGNYVIKVSASHGGTLGDSAFLLAPDFGTNTVDDLISRGQISDTTTAAQMTLNNATATRLGLEPDLVSIKDISGMTLDATTRSLTITGSLGKSLEDFVAAAKGKPNGAGLTVATGIPMTVIVISQGTRPGINIGYGTYKRSDPHALLGVPDEIVLSPGQTSKTANVSNDEREGYVHTPNINVTGVKWGGTGNIKSDGLLPSGMEPNESDSIALTIDWVDTSTFQDIDKVTGVITVIYDVVDPDTSAVLYRDLEATIPVRTVGPSATPIEVTVWTTDDPDTSDDETKAENLTTTITIPDETGDLALANVTDVFLMNAIEYEALTFTPAGWSDDFVGFAGDGAPKLKWEIPEAGMDESWLLYGMTTPIDGSVAVPVLTVTAGTAKGDYVGVMNIAYLATDGYSAMGGVAVPVIIHVKAIQGEAVFHKNLNGTDTATSPAHGGGGYTGDAGTTVTSMPANPIKSGSVFKGWATTNNATDALSANDIVYGSGMNSAGKAAHYYAVWETTVQTYDVTYHLDTGESWPSGVSDPSRTGVTTHKVTAETPTKSGYDFLGWTTVSNGTATAADPAYAANTTITLTDDLDLYPVWAKLYSITYTNPGATGVAATETAPLISLPNASTSQAGKPVTVSNTIALNSSHQDTSGRYYKFKGWSDGTTTYNPAGSFTMPASNVTLEAQWELEKVTVTLDPQSHGAASIPSAWGSSAPYAQNINKGANITLPTLTETGWTFQGWATSAENAAAGTVAVNGGTAVSNVQADATYYAVWKETQYTVTFNPNGGTWATAPTGGTKTSSGTLNAKITVPDTLTRSGYSFKEWNTAQDGTGEKLDTASHTYGDKSGNTYYAIWDQLYEVKYQDATDTADHTYPKIGANLPTETAKKADDSVTVKYASGYAVNAEKTNTSGRAYKFLGWTISPTVVVTSGAFSMPASAVTLTANWEPVMQKVTYKHNGMKESDGTPTPDYVANNAVQKGADYTITVNDPVWPGHTFSGWTVTSGATSASRLHKNDSVNGVTGDVVLTAQWSENSYKVRFWMNDGVTPAVAHATQEVVHGNKATKPATDPTRTGYNFGGWYKEEGCNNAVDFNDAITGDTDYYAKWTLKNYPVTYAWGNIGTTVKMATGTAVALPTQSNVDHGGSFDVADTPNATDIYLDSDNTGWKLTGWTISGTGQSGSKAPGAEVTNVTSAITLTGVWARETRKVSYNLNGKTFASLTAPSDTSVNYNATANLSTAVTMNQNYVDTDGKGWTFKGWGPANDTAVGSNITSIANVTENKTVYAIWAPTMYTVTFYPNGGNNLDDTNATKAVSVQHGDKVADDDVPTATRTGYTFSKWVEGSASSTTEFVNGTRTITANLNVYAQWDVDHYQVGFYFNGKGGTDTTETQEVGKDVALKTPSTVTGYTFGGWYTDDGTFANQQTGAVSGTGRTDGEVVKLYAKWTPINYTITYADPQSGADSGMPSPLAQAAAYDSTHTLASAPTGKTGYVWDGWYDGNTKVTADFTVTGNRTLNAKWKITVSFEIHDPTSTLSDPASQVIAAGNAVTLPTQTDLTDYKFLGWFAAASGGTKLSGSENYSTPTTLHAQWEAKPYTYTFNPNGGAFPAGTNNTSTSGGVGATITAPSNDPTRTDYTFLGWGTSSTSTSADAVVATTMPSGGGTVYAVWKANTYGYVFDPTDGAFGSTETGLQDDGTVKKTGAVNTTVDAPTNPTRADYDFDGWYTAETGGTKVTTHTIPGGASFSDGAVTKTVYAHWIPLYDVTYINGYSGDQHGTVDTTKNVVNQKAYTYKVENPNAAIPAGTGESWNGGNTYFSDAGGHWKFLYWEADDTNKTKYYGGNEFILNRDTVLTAVWEQTYKVTLGEAVSAADSATKLATANVTSTSASFNSTTMNTGSGGTKFVWVKAGDPVNIASPSLSGANTGNYVFAKWTATDSTGAFGSAGANVEATEFTPTADTTLTPNYWLKPSLSGAQKHHLNKDVDAVISTAPWNGGQNTLPVYNWTKNDAELASSNTLEISDDNGATWTPLTVGTAGTAGVEVASATDSDGNVTYTFQRDYLLTLTVPDGDTSKTFKVRVNSKTPAGGTDTKLSADLTVYVTPEKLEKVNIWAKDGVVGHTANVKADSGRDQVKYKDHTPTAITASNKLTYTWYVGASAPDQYMYSTTLAQRVQSVTNAKNAAAAKGTPIPGSVDTNNNYVDITGVNDYKGKYIYAVVAASGTGYGAVITNAIAVDYDAVIKVTKDGDAGITGGNYKVYLVPNGVTPTVSGGELTGAGVVEAEYQSGNQYKTDDSALTGGVTYKVYVNKVEGNFTTFEDTTLTVKTQTDATANNIPTVEFFSVNEVETKVKDAEDSTPTKVGETFKDADKPTTVFTTAGAGSATITVTSGNGVFKGSAITAKTSKGDFAQDYHVDWGVTNTEPTETAPLGYNAEASKQTKAYAASDGITVTNSISKKTWAGAQLDQNVYEIKGNIKGTGKVDSATLTYKKGETTYTFNGNVGSGGNGDTVTFKVPKSGVDAGAITGAYTISAKGSNSPKTTVMGYSVPSKDGLDQKLPMELEPVSEAGTEKFTIFIESSTWSLKVEDDHKQNALLSGTPAAASAERTHTTAVTAANNVSTGTATTSWTKTFANYDATTDQMVYEVTVSNPGNTDLKVSLVLKRGTDVIYDASTALTGNKDANDVAFGGLAASFDLAGKTGATTASKAFTVTIPADLDNDDDVTYSFEFTSKDANDATIYGPSLTYKLALTVNPIPVKSVSIKDNNDGTYSADALTFDATKAPLDQGTAPTLTTANDLTYQWYVGTEPQLNATTGAITNAASLTAATGAGYNTDTYTPTTADGGKTLWLVVSGTNNASKAAKASVAAPYSAKVTIMEDDAETTDYTSYKVYLVPSDVTTQPTDWTAAGIVEATHKDDDGDGVFTSDAVLVNGKTYNVWTNVVKGTTNAVYKNNGALGTVTDGVASKTVTYYSVTMNKTTYDNKYTDLKGTDFFGTGDDGTTAAPQTGDTGLTATAKAGATDVASGGWVVAGTVVDFSHEAWSKDYTLAWTGATKQGTDAAGGGSAAKATVNANTTVDAKLTLTLYNVTAYVMGAGTTNYITMTADTDANKNVFTTKTGTPSGSILGIASSRGSISATETGTPVEFSVPKGTYVAAADVTSGSGTNLDGYHITHGDTDVKKDPITKTITAADTFDVVLTSTGVGLSVTDDDVPHSVQGMYESEDVAVTADPHHTETLQYGYSGTKDIVLTLKNVSANDATGHKQLVYSVAGVGGDATGSPASGVTWTSTALTSDGTTTTIDVLSENDAPTVTLTIPNGLAAGTYTYNAVFTFSAEEGGATVGTLTYPLEIVVEPAQFATVAMKYDGGATPGAVLEAGKALALDTATTTVNDVFANLTGGTDYHYAWYASTDSSIATANLNWNDATGAVTFTGGKTATAIGTADQILTAATIADHQSEYIYLMIYATANNGKVIKAAISAPVRAGYQGVVQIKENGALQAAEPKTDGTAKYTVFIMDGATAIPTKWDGDLKGYVAVDGSGDPIYLDPTKTYTVKTSAYEGDTTTTALTGATIKGDNLAGNSHIATAEYFTVTAVETTAKHYVDDVGETFGAMPKAKLSVGAADVDGKTVLKGQNVAAKFDAVDDGKAWTQDYTLTWQEKRDNTADGSSLTDTTLTDTATSAVTGQTWSNIQAKTYIGGRLDQNTYTITGSIEGSGTVASVVMTDGNSNANTTVAGGTINKDNKNEISDAPGKGNNNGTTGDAGDKITLIVVKGTYALKANAGNDTTVVGVKWNTDARVSGDSVSEKDVSADKTFVVYLNAASAGLRVADTHTTPTAHEATSNPASAAQNFKHADHTHEVYFSAMTADEELTVNLKNKGNTDLTLDTPTVWKVNAGKALSDVNWSSWTNAGNPVAEIGTDGAYAETDVIAIANKLTDDNKTLSGATTDATGAQLDNGGAVDAATITIDKKVDVADSGIYIIRYTTGDNGPVAYYVLNLVVKQLPIVQVETNNDGSMVDVGATITAEGYDATDNKSLNNVLVQRSGTTTDTGDAATANLTDADIKFAWVKVNAGATAPAKANLSVASDGTLSSTVGNVVSQSETYTLVDGDQDKDFYLVAFAPNYTGNVTNATDKAISAVVKAKRTVGVKVSVDGPTISPTSDPGYEVYLVESDATASITRAEDGTVTLGAGTWATKWNNTTKRYEAPIDVENKTYEVYAVSYLNGTTVLKAIDDTLGKQDPTGTTTEVIVPYYTVSFTQNVAVDSKYDKFASYLPNGTAGSDNAIQEALSVTVSKTKGGATTGGDKLPASATGTVTAIPVLKDMNVAVTVDATKSSNNATDGVKKSWSETDVQPLHTLAATGWTPSDTTYADSITSNADIAVTGAKTFSAKLEQVLFEVTFTVVDNTPSETKSESGYVDPRIVKAKLTPDGAKEAATSSFEVDVYGTAATAAGYIGAGTDGQAGTAGATVTFKGVPKGGYEILVTETGNRTKVDGFTWNAKDDDLNKPIDPGKIVDTNTTDAVNKHEGNTIQIQYSSYAVQWKDNFITSPANGTVGGAHDTDFYNSTGFQKVDTAETGPFLALSEGYDDTSVLTYKVQVENTGAMAMEQFYINQTNVANLKADLENVTIIRADGPTEDGVDVSKPGSVTLGLGDIVEFTVTIPDGQKARLSNYTSAFEVKSTSSSNISKSTYTPAYQVKPNVSFDGGKAVVIYGNNKFEDTPVNIKPGWDTAAYRPDFVYSVLTEDELTKYLNGLDGAPRDANVYTKDGKTGGESKLPAWLVLNTATGAVTFDTTLHATEVNVQVNGTPEDFEAYDDDANGHKVDDEIVFYIKAVDQDTGVAYYTTYTVDVEPGQLAIEDGDFAYTTDEAVGGLSVDRSKFTYTKVTNMADNPLDVVPALPDSAKHTGAGNDPSQDTPTNGKVFVNDGTDNVHTATWTVAPDKYVSEVATDYVFTVTYKPDTPAEKWNYKPATYTKNIEARKPDMSLKFADAIDNATKVVKGETYTDPEGEELTGLNGDVPVELAYFENVKRLGESITYLDEEPTYTVKIQKIGAIYGMKLVEDAGTKGFQVEGTLPTFETTDTDDNEDLILTLKLSEISAGLWAGEHKISFTATGYSAQALAEEGGDPDVTATYELSLNVRKKLIPEAHVSELTDPVKFETPDTAVTVTIQDPTDPDTMVKLDELDEDKYGNKPIDTVKVEHDPGDDPFEPDTEYTTTVTLEANPNYTFEDDKAPEEANYTAGDEPGEDETYPDGGYDVELTPDDPTKPEAGKNTKVTFTKVTKTAEAVLKLEFNDTDPDDEEDVLDSEEWNEDYENSHVVVYYLDEIPDFYDVYLQNPGTEDLYNVGLRVTGNAGTRNDGGTGNDQIGLVSADDDTTTLGSSVSTTAFTTLDEIKATGEESQTKSFKADLRDLKYAGTYTLTVRAEGTTTKPTDQASLMATGNRAVADYTLIVKIVPRPIVVANVTGLGAAEVGQMVGDNVSKIGVAGKVLYRGDESIDGGNKDNVSDKSDVDLINKGEDTEWGPENGLDVNGLTRLGYQIRWYEVDENGNATELNADPEEGDAFKPGTAYRVVLKLIPDPNYTFIRASTEDHPYGSDEDFFYYDPKDNGKTGVEDNPRIDAEQIEYNMTVTTATGVKKVVPLYPQEDEESTAPNRPIIIEKKQQGEIAQLRFDDVKVDNSADTTGPAVHDKRTVSVTKGTKPGVYHINLGAYIDNVDQVSVVEESITGKLAEIVTKVDPETGETSYVNNWTFKKLDEPHDTRLEVDENGNPTNKNTWELDLSGLDTSSAGTDVFVLTIKVEGIRTLDEAGLETELIKADYTLTVNITNPGGGGGGGGGGVACPYQVTFLLGLQGTTNDPVMEMVAGKSKVKSVPTVTALEGYQFIGWSRTAPTGDMDKDSKRELVKPLEVTVDSDTTFYAVYQKLYDVPQPPFHEHYVIGYPDGNFGPADNINRASVATIIARAVLPNFVEGADYGNPGGYSDVDGHWAASAIAYCSKYGVFKGYNDGTFRPNQSITRQELALVIARLSGVQSAKSDVPFVDMDEAGSWAVDGIYTAYANGWVNGYVDGTFKPLNPIRRDETVKIFNAYLHRGVNAEGLEGLTEYVHSGVASNNHENGSTEYMTWPDVTRDQWAYYEIIEAANDHEFKVDPTVPGGYTVPETWDKCWINEKWRYHDDLTDGGPTTGLLTAGFRIWSK